MPEGATGTIEENGLNEIWCCLLVTPDDEAIRTKLANWNGDIQFCPENDGLWDEPSPLEEVKSKCAKGTHTDGLLR